MGNYGGYGSSYTSPYSRFGGYGGMGYGGMGYGGMGYGGMGYGGTVSYTHLTLPTILLV